MLSENQIRSVALFFLFALLDERAAMPYANRVTAVLKTKLGRHAEESTEAKQIVLGACYRQFQKIKKDILRGQVSTSLSSVLTLPSGADLGAWIRFHKDATDDELLALIFSKIMGFSDFDIAQALGVSEGTIRYRISHAVRRLGETQRGMHRGAV